jgi:hypothetical protein
MKTPLELQYTPSQGATKFLIMVEPKLSRRGDLINELPHDTKPPIQKGDEYFLQEIFYQIDNPDFGTWHKAEWDLKGGCLNKKYEWQSASEMTYEQSRFKGTCIDVQLKRAKQLSHKDMVALGFDAEKSLSSDERLIRAETGYEPTEDYPDRAFEWFKDWLDSNFGEGTCNKNGYFWVVSKES